jgi:hypothetical protein
LVGSYNWAIPFDRAFSHAPKRLTRGWNITGISRFSTGFPISMRQSSGDLSLVGDSNNDMPNRVGPIVIMDPRSTSNHTYFEQSAFAKNTTLGTFGTSARRFFHGPGILNTDFGMSKRVPITESMAVEFRGEFFNIFNHTQFNNPTGNISSGNFGNVTNARDPRIGQVSAKFYW